MNSIAKILLCFMGLLSASVSVYADDLDALERSLGEQLKEFRQQKEIILTTLRDEIRESFQGDLDLHFIKEKFELKLAFGAIKTYYDHQRSLLSQLQSSADKFYQNANNDFLKLNQFDAIVRFKLTNDVFLNRLDLIKNELHQVKGYAAEITHIKNQNCDLPQIQKSVESGASIGNYLSFVDHNQAQSVREIEIDAEAIRKSLNIDPTIYIGNTSPPSGFFPKFASAATTIAISVGWSIGGPVGALIGSAVALVVNLVVGLWEAIFGNPQKDRIEQKTAELEVLVKKEIPEALASIEINKEDMIDAFSKRCQTIVTDYDSAYAEFQKSVNLQIVQIEAAFDHLHKNNDEYHQAYQAYIQRFPQVLEKLRNLPGEIRTLESLKAEYSSKIQNLFLDAATFYKEFKETKDEEVKNNLLAVTDVGYVSSTLKDMFQKDGNNFDFLGLPDIKRWIQFSNKVREKIGETP